MSNKVMNEIIPLSIIDEHNDTIFHKANYIIPLYQRAFAWTEKEIEQLIDDIYDFEAEHYYLGSLIVNVNPNGVYEVIDGQQRLTALFLLLNYLGYSWDKNKLSYECRMRSNHTLNHLKILSDKSNTQAQLTDADKIEDSLIKGRETIANKFNKNDKSNKEGIDRTKFIEQLKKVILFRIEVPAHTDLNRYFEIMNVRGEQLEQHDILKAKLMKPLEKAHKGVFAVVWDACRNMTGYVQMHFSKEHREQLFCGGWDWLNLEELFKLSSHSHIEQEQSAIEIIQSKNISPNEDRYDESGNRVRFKSIIDFPFFLLHVLKVFVSKELDKDSYTIPELLDDKKLLDTFTNVIKAAQSNGKQVSEKDFSLLFIKYLLKCRFLFDKYIIKREYKNDNSDGEWSLKELKVSGARSKKKPYYKDTYFGEYNEWESTYSPRTKINLMLQSCMRVSYTSPKIMHWITQLLQWLNEDANLQLLSQYEMKAEEISQEPVRKFISEKNFKQGVNTPHIVINYLDYLLWKDRNNYKDLNFDEFVFEFRNSVEHWYPRNPSENPWDDVNRFGNLCLLQRDINSKFSNLPPTAKKSYEERINKGSLKLRLMSKLTDDNAAWRETLCEQHENEMLVLLKKHCGIEEDS